MVKKALHDEFNSLTKYLRNISSDTLNIKKPRQEYHKVRTQYLKLAEAVSVILDSSYSTLLSSCSQETHDERHANGRELSHVTLVVE